MVHFVGAGPGAVDLITVRGRELLQKADVIIYAGSLVNPALLTYAKKEASIHNSAEMTLEEVFAVTRQANSEGKDIVRLHTGEPSIYGAIREQMDLLEKEQIPYDVTPGVSACFGAAAGLNLEFTLPGISQTLIVTRAEGRTAVPEKEKLRDLARHQTSMAIYLSAGMPDVVAKELIEGGYAPETPAALVYKATWDEEKRVLCTLATLAAAAKQEGITKTAVILVGDAIAHSGYERSKLYDPAFSTGYRDAKDK